MFHLARQAFERLLKLSPDLEPHRPLLYAAALLHDIGHGPLSHTGEEMFGLHHESWSAQIAQNHPQIQACLDQEDQGTAQAVAALLEHGQAPHPVVKRLVSSQLDCDRLDYLLRDSYSTGTRYGQLDLERIMAGLTLSPDGDLAIHPKGLMAVEHYLVVRNLMYRSVYNHRLNVVCNWLLERLVRLARQLGPDLVWADGVMQRWQEEGPPALASLCRRFRERDLLKATAVTQLTREEQLQALAVAGRLAEQRGIDPSLSCGLRHQELRGYHPYRGGLRLWDGQRMQALEEASPLVASLATPAATSWLIHPREIQNELKSAMDVEWGSTLTSAR